MQALESFTQDLFVPSVRQGADLGRRWIFFVVRALHHYLSMDTRVRKILLVDDQPDIVLFLERLLAHPTVEFYRACRGEEALSIARREHPDLILVDVCMPGMDGLEVCEAVKQDPDLTATRVILMSAIIGESGIRTSADGLRADGYFAKPFNLEAVRSGVRAMLH